MKDLIGLIVPIFATPKNYSEMLMKLAGFAFWQALVITLLLRRIPQFDAALKQVDAFIPFGSTLGAPILIAVLAACASRMFHFHDRISDLLRIRQRFDVEHIMLPLADLVGAHIPSDKRKLLEQDRHRLMRQVFYNYTSSSNPTPLVDRHEIEHALDQWSWFWTLVEGAAFWLVGSIVAFVLGDSLLSGWLFLVALVFAGLAIIFSRRLPKYARPQIEAIAQDPTAAANVKATFDAL